jgi:hypothetical protein
MLRNLAGKAIHSIPKKHFRDFQIYRKRLTDEEYSEIKKEIRNRITSGKPVVPSEILSARQCTTLQPVIQNACKKNKFKMTEFFGMILREFMIEDEHEWWVYQDTGPEAHIHSAVYFDKPPDKKPDIERM